MPLPFRVVLRRESDQSVDVCAGEIADTDWDLIEAFRGEATKLRTSEWVLAGLDTHHTVSGDSTGKMVIDWPNPPSDAAVHQLLHLLRPFILKNEQTYFPKFTGRLWRYFTHSYLRQLLAEHRQGFDHGYGRAYFTLSVSPDGGQGNDEDDLVINDARAFDLWVNAFEYHRDETKRRLFLEKLGTVPNDLTLTNFRCMIADKARAVLHVAAFLDDLVASPTAQSGQRAR